jgi:hypothetical protein
MKKLIFTLVFVFLTAVLFGQITAIQEFHNKYKDNGKYITVHIEGGLLKVLSNIDTEDEDTDDLLNVISKLEGIDLHAIDKREAGFSEKDIKKLKKEIRKEKFDELLLVREGETNIDFLVKEKNGKISDLLLLIDEAHEFVVLNFTGEIDLAALTRLSDELDIKGAKHLKKMEEKKD